MNSRSKKHLFNNILVSLFFLSVWNGLNVHFFFLFECLLWFVKWRVISLPFAVCVWKKKQKNTHSLTWNLASEDTSTLALYSLWQTVTVLVLIIWKCMQSVFQGCKFVTLHSFGSGMGHYRNSFLKRRWCVEKSPKTGHPGKPNTLNALYAQCHKTPIWHVPGLS